MYLRTVLRDSPISCTIFFYAMVSRMEERPLCKTSIKFNLGTPTYDQFTAVIILTIADSVVGMQHRNENIQ
jgi:hypothetical protein